MENIKNSHRESDDNYTRIVANLDNRWRVILCRDGLQWILQRGSLGKHEWRGVSFCQTRAALLRCISEKVEGIDLEDMAEVEALPVRTSMLFDPTSVA